MKTAVDWLEEKLRLSIGDELNSLNGFFVLAKEMEKQQMEKSFAQGYKSGITDYMDIQNGYDGRAINFDQYYNEVYLKQ